MGKNARWCDESSAFWEIVYIEKKSLHIEMYINKVSRSARSSVRSSVRSVVLRNQCWRQINSFEEWIYAYVHQVNVRWLVGCVRELKNCFCLGKYTDTTITLFSSQFAPKSPMASKTNFLIKYIEISMYTLRNKQNSYCVCECAVVLALDLLFES